MSIEQNPFEELCRLASLSRWCLDPACTTCGNRHLSAGLALIAHGVPLAAWDHTTTKWPEELVPWTRWTLGAAESARLAETLGDADLSEIKKKSMSPLLDCLELVLVRSGLSESDRDGVEKVWSERFGRESRMEKEEQRLRILESIRGKYPGFIQRDIRNGFEKLCHLAAQNHWNWGIRNPMRDSPGYGRLEDLPGCNLHLRAGLLLIARNIPFGEWDYTKDRWPDELLPSGRGRLIPLRMPESARLAEVLAAADLVAIRKDAVLRWFERSCDEKTASGREDWLGYLGVALLRSQFSPPHREQVGKSWREQLNRMDGSRAPDSTPVAFEELEAYERRLSQEHLGKIYQI